MKPEADGMGEDDADLADVIEGQAGVIFPRYRDPVTQLLGLLTSEWESSHKDRMGTVLRMKHIRSARILARYRRIIEDKERTEIAVARMLTAQLREHPLWPWLERLPGLRGVHVARLISMIGDPLRFPGRLCIGADRHVNPEDWTGTCGMLVKMDDEWRACGETLGPRRRGTGTRPLWHFLGLHVVDGELPKKPRRGSGLKCSWRPTARGAICQEDGIRDQIVRQRVQPYRDVYDRAKERLLLERGPEKDNRPFRIDRIARTIAAKAFAADLLAAWKKAIR